MAQTPVLRWCLDNFPGFHEFPNDYQAPVGPSVTLMADLAKRVGAKLQMSPRTPNARCFRQMQLGEADVMTNLNYTDERDSLMHLLAYRQRIPEAVLQRAGSSLTIHSTKDLAPLTLVSVRGYVYHPDLMQAIAQHNPTQRIEVASIGDGLAMLEKGRVDAMITPGVATLEYIENHQEYHYKFQRAPLAPTFAKTQYIYLGISRRSEAVTLIPQLQQAIKQMTRDGTIERLYRDAEHSGGVQFLVPLQDHTP